MAYFLGYLFADGSLEYSPNFRGHYVRATSSDRILLENLKTRIRSEHTLVELPKHEAHHKQLWLLRIGNKSLYASLRSHGLEPRKSLTMQCPEIPQHCLGAFTRGYFDGDGCVHIERSAGVHGQPILKRLRVIFTSGSYGFLFSLHRQLDRMLRLGLDSGHLYTGTSAHRLVYSTIPAVMLFKLMYDEAANDLLLWRKYDIFKEYLTLRHGRGDEHTQRIIQRMAQW